MNVHVGDYVKVQYMCNGLTYHTNPSVDGSLHSTTKGKEIPVS